MVRRAGHGLLTMMAALLLGMAAGCDFSGGNDAGHPLFKQGKREMEKENYAEAVKYFQRYLRIRPDSARAHLLMAGIYDENLDSQINAIYHYQEFLRLATDPTEAKNVEKWLATAQRKYYVKMKTRFNDPEIVAALQDELAGADLRIKKLVESHNKLTTVIAENKTSSAQLSSQLAAVQAEKEKFDADLTIAREKQQKLDSELAAATDKVRRLEEEQKKLRQLYWEETQKTKKLESENTGLTASLAVLKDELAKTAAALARPAQAPRVQPPSAPSPAKSVSAPAPTAMPAEKLATPETKTEDKSASLPSPESVAVPEVTKVRFYTVKAGDSLSKIAKQFYGAAKYYKLIQEENQAELGPENRMLPGQVLKIPPLRND